MLNPNVERIHVEEDHHINQQESCSRGHRSTMLLETPSRTKICIACFSSLLSDPSSSSLHISFAISQLCLVDSFHQYAHILVTPLVRALFCNNFARDDALCKQVVDLVVGLCGEGESGPVAGDFVALITDQLCDRSGIVRWNRCYAHALHCLGILLNYHPAVDLTSHIRDKMALFSNLIAGIRLPSEELRGEILFLLYKLSDLRATPWDTADCDDSDGVDSSLAELKISLLRFSLETLLKTQHDDVRLNCLAMLTILAQRGLFQNLFVISHSRMSYMEANSSIQKEDAAFQDPLINLFADSVKGPLLSSDTQVQIRTLDLIIHLLSSDTNREDQIKVFVDENIADYVFEMLKLSGNKDSLVVSCIQVLSLLSSAHESFLSRLPIGFPTLLCVLRYVAEIPLHPVQSQLLKLIWVCISDCPGVISLQQLEEIILILTKYFKRHTACEVEFHTETFILACSTFVEILKSPSATSMPNLSAMTQEALSSTLLSSLSLPHGNTNHLLLYSLYLMKEAYTNSFDYANSDNNELEKSIVESCIIHLLPWFERALDEGEEEIVVLDLLEAFHLVLLKGSESETQKFADVLVSSSWFGLSFRCLGLFPSDEMKLRVYLMLSSVTDKILGHESGNPIRDACTILSSDPLDLLFIMGQRSSYDDDLICCQRAVLLILYISSLYGESLANGSQVLASLEQYIIVNSSNFLNETADSTMLTQLILLYGLVRSTPTGYNMPYSPEAENKLFQLIAGQEWDFLKMSAQPISLKWLLQQDKLVPSLSQQFLNFCRLHSNEKSILSFHSREVYKMDIPMVAELIIFGDNNMTLVLVSLLKHLHDDCMEDDLISLVNVISEILDIYPKASNHFILYGIHDVIRDIYCSILSSSQIFQIISNMVFKILSSADRENICEGGDWFAVTNKLLEFLNAKLVSYSYGDEECLMMGILCLLLHHSTYNVLKEASIAILHNKSLIYAVDDIIHTVLSKGPSLGDQGESCLNNCLIFILLLYFFSLKSLCANFQETLVWQDFIQTSDDSMKQLSVIHIKCHDLCRLLHYGSDIVKRIASQCLLELLTGISVQTNTTTENNFKCSLNYLESMMAVAEGFVFHEDNILAMNCAMCLSIMLSWEKSSLLESRVVNDASKWLRLIVEELVMSMAVPSLAAKVHNNQHKPLVCVAAAVVSLKKIPKWVESVFDPPSVSGIIENISATNVSKEMVLLLRMLMRKKFLNQEQVARLHHLFQACREEVYEETSRERFKHVYFDSANDIPEDTRQICNTLLHHMMHDSNISVQAEHSMLLAEIDMFFQESTTYHSKEFAQ